jgi:cell division cycle 2-like protein
MIKYRNIEKNIFRSFLRTNQNYRTHFSINLLEKCYKKLGLIDAGTYGKVFRTRKIHSQNIYACKKVRLEYHFNENLSTSLREISLLLSLSHPNIILARETRFGKSLNNAFIVMEYCEYDLKSILNSKIKFSGFQIKYIMKQIIRGMKILHENFIIHRDLKTSNILLNRKGIIKICDFGLARILPLPGSFLTQGVVTLWYRAPEILLGQDYYKTAVDVWSVGCIFAELILNEVLFPGKTELDQLSKIFSLLGTPTSEIWLGLHMLPAIQKIKFPIQPFNNLKKKFYSKIEFSGIDLLQRFLTFDPNKRINLFSALKHPFFL